MNNVDKVLKESKLLFDSAKDMTVKNLMNAVSTKLIDLDESQLAKLISVVNLSLDEGYLRAVPSFQRSLNRVMSEK